MAYNDNHRQFLQYIMTKRLVSEENAKRINENLFPDKNVDLTIEIINSKIYPLEFKINKTVCEQNGDISYVLIASFYDDFNKKPDLNRLTFGKLVDYIVEAGGCVPYNEVITFNCHMTETILNTFFANKYLVADDDQNIFLSSLAISELEVYLAEKFAENRCMACMRCVVHGIKCQSCGKFAHGHCLKEYFKNLESQKCLKCSKQLQVNWNPIIINYEL